MMKEAPIALAYLVGTAVFTVVACGPAAGSGSSDITRAGWIDHEEVRKREEGEQSTGRPLE